jgi:hypothetical protein
LIKPGIDDIIGEEIAEEGIVTENGADEYNPLSNDTVQFFHILTDLVFAKGVIRYPNPSI